MKKKKKKKKNPADGVFTRKEPITSTVDDILILLL